MTSPAMTSPRFLYLHGFASSPESKKAKAFAAFFEARGLPLARLDLRVPSMERLSFPAMMAVVRAAIGGPSDRALIVGSSLGGLCAARVAAADPRVSALFLMAPAFDLGARWRERLGPEAWEDWRATGFREVHDHATGKLTRVHHAFVAELDRMDRELGRLPDVAVPTCVVHGTRDDVVDVSTSRELAKGRRHVRLVEVDDDHELAASTPRILAELEAFARPFGLG